MYRDALPVPAAWAFSRLERSLVIPQYREPSEQWEIERPVGMGADHDSRSRPLNRAWRAARTSGERDAMRRRKSSFNSPHSAILLDSVTKAGISRSAHKCAHSDSMDGFFVGKTHGCSSPISPTPLPQGASGTKCFDRATPLLEIRVFRGWSSGFHGQRGPSGFAFVADLGPDDGRRRGSLVRAGRIEARPARRSPRSAPARSNQRVSLPDA